MRNFLKKVFTNVWYLWIFLTAIYLPLSLILPAVKLNLIAYALSIFVPIGIWNFSALFGVLATATVGIKYLAPPALLIGLALAHFVSQKLPQRTWLLLIFNLLVLYLISSLIDLLIWGNWFQSLDFYENAGSQSFFF